MIRIESMKEKELIIAHYFCNKTRKQLTQHEVFDMWNNWFKNDFKPSRKKMFKVMPNNQLGFCPDCQGKKDGKLRTEYNKLFQLVYQHIETIIDSKNIFQIKEMIDKERAHTLAKLAKEASPFGLWVLHAKKDKSYKELGEYRLLNQKENKSITAGSYDKVHEYLSKLLKEEQC